MRVIEDIRIASKKCESGSHTPLSLVSAKCFVSSRQFLAAAQTSIKMHQYLQSSEKGLWSREQRTNKLIKHGLKLSETQ